MAKNARLVLSTSLLTSCSMNAPKIRLGRARDPAAVKKVRLVEASQFPPYLLHHKGRKLRRCKRVREATVRMLLIEHHSQVLFRLCGIGARTRDVAGVAFHASRQQPQLPRAQ